MLTRQLLFGLIVGIFVCNPQEIHSQFIRNVPLRGSISKANSNAYEGAVDFGPLEFTKGVSNSRSITKANGGARNGGLTSVSNTNALSRGVNLGGLDIGSTLTQTQSRNNGAVSRGVGHDLNVGNFGIGTSLSRDNLRNGFGLQAAPGGGVSLGLGLLNVGLTNNAQQGNGALTQAEVNAQGKNAKVRSGGNSLTNTQQYGLVGVKETYANSKAAGRTKFGQTSASTSGLANGATTSGGTAFNRPRRTVLRSSKPVKGASYFRPRRALAKSRPKRQIQFIPFAYPDESVVRVRRQFGFQRQPQGFGGFGGFQGGFGGFQPNRQNANSQGIANNKFNGFQQQAGTNSHSNNEFNQGGFFQDNGASSIGSNIHDSGDRGQVSSANVNQMNSQTADGSSSTNNAQSQSLNFDPNMQQAASSNAGTEHLQNGDSESIKANSGSQASNNNEFGSSSNIANTNSAVVREGNRETVTSDASSQSIFQGANGGSSGAFTNSQTNSSSGPGFSSNSASSSASATSNGGGPANAVASASAGSVAGGGGASGGKRRKGSGNITFPAAYQSQFFTYNRREPHRQQSQSQSQPRQLPVYISTASSSILINRQNRSTASRQQFPVSMPGDTEIIDLRRPQYVQEANTPVNGDESINNTTEQFGAIDESVRQGRTFQFITDFINSLTPCVYPCTIDAFRNNRCCIVYPPQPLPPLPPPLPPPRPCCFPPPPPPPPPMIPRPPPINCCVSCISFGYYGPPPCYGFGFGGAPAPLFGRLSNNAVGWGRATAALQSSSDSAGTQVTIYVPRPSSLTSLCVSTRNM